MRGHDKTSYVSNIKVIVTKNRIKSITFKSMPDLIDKSSKGAGSGNSLIEGYKDKIRALESQLNFLMGVDVESYYDTSKLFLEYEDYQSSLDSEMLVISEKLDRYRELLNELELLKESQKITARMNYYKKRKEDIVLLTECNNFTTFLTITLDEDLSESDAKKEFKKARQRLMTYLDVREIKGIVKYERGSINERSHFHLILDIPYVDNNSKWRYEKKRNCSGNVVSTNKVLNNKYSKYELARAEVVANTSNRSPGLKRKREKLLEEGQSLLSVVIALGYCQINRMRKNSKKAASYVAKYIAKDMQNKELHKRNIWTIGKLDKPKRLVYDESVKEIIKIINNDFETDKASYENEYVSIINYNAKKYNQFIDLYNIAHRFDLDVNSYYMKDLKGQMNVNNYVKNIENKILEEVLK